MAITKPTKALWIALRLTHLPLESLKIQRGNINIMVSHKNRICTLTDNLIDQGVYPGIPTATAQLLLNNDHEIPCRIYERELASEKQSLFHICDTLYQHTPHIETYCVQKEDACEEHGILLEISRCLRLFKGVDNIFKRITSSLDTLGFSYRYAFGHTKHAAWLLSYATQMPIPNENETAQTFINYLRPLALDYIYEHPDSVTQLKKTGFFTFGNLISHIEQHSFHSLRKRFGESFSQFLSDVLDIDDSVKQASLFKKPVTNYHPQQIFIESLQFDYPVSNTEQLEHPIKTLLSYLTRTLVQQQKQTQQLHWHLYDIHHNQEQFPIRIERLHSDTQLAEELTMIRLENQPLPFEVDVLELRCESIFPVHFENRQTHNDQHYDIEQHALATVTAKLNARLGENAVFTLAPRDSHIPELSYRRNVPRQSHPLSPNDLPAQNLDRPSWIFNTPIKIGRRQNALFWKGKLELLQGPERIEGLWWKKPTGRDYFIAKRDDHVRLWVFHDLYKDGWFVHGVFA